MATLWMIYTAIIIVTFGEPDRGGLEEQKQLEEAKNVTEETGTPDSSVLKMDESLQTILSADGTVASSYTNRPIPGTVTTGPTWWISFRERTKLIILPVRLCLFFLFCKTFTIEALVSATSALTKNRYNWQIVQVGTLGCINGILVIPLSVTVGWLSLYCQDRLLMTVLVSIGIVGTFLLIDFTDLVSTPNSDGYNDWSKWAVHPPRYVTGYFLAFCSIQSFEGVIGSTLSKVIPTALASGTFNSGLLATLVDTVSCLCLAIKCSCLVPVYGLTFSMSSRLYCSWVEHVATYLYSWWAE